MEGTKLLTGNHFAPPAFKVEKEWYKQHKTEDGENGNAFSLLAAQDPSPPDHIDHIYNKKLLELKVDPATRRRKALQVWDWAEKAATIERHLMSCKNLQDSGGYKRTTVGKFMGSADSAALFPAFIESQIAAALLRVGIVGDVVMGTEDVGSNTVRIFEFDDTEIERELSVVGIGQDIPEMDITTGEGSLDLGKYGKAFKFPVEIKSMASIDTVGQMLQRIGKQIAITQSDLVMHVSIAGDGTGRTLGAADTNATDTDVAVANAIAYSDLLTWVYSPDESYELDVAVAGRTDMPLIANLAEFKDPDVGRSPSRTQFTSPLSLFYQRWQGGVTGSSYVDRLVVGFDSSQAMKAYQWGPNIQQTEQVILSQSERHVFAFWFGVSKMDTNAVRVLDVSAAL
jgi:hypothetical protein